MVDLKPHNLETYERVKEIFKTKNRACCVQPTGSGKSYLALKLFEDNPSARKLVLEPQHYIREQLQSKVTEDMGEVQFITYSKLAKMSDEDIAALEPDIIVLDEFHRAGAKEWGGKGVQRLLESYPESKVLGLSATPIRYLDSGRNMAEELFEGTMANNISLAEAIVRRILPLPRYITGLYLLDGEVESINKKIEQSYNSPEEKKTLLKQVREMKKQLDKSNGVSSILHKYILEPNGKYIVFCKDIKHLNQMKPMLEQWFAEAGFQNVRLYVVHSKNENKDAEFKKFKEDDGDGIRLCLVVSMLNEGVHIQGIDGVIMLRNTISAGLFFQQIGRAISCNSKGIPLILDLVANVQSVTECNLKTDIEKAILIEKERNKGFSSEGLEVEKFFVMDQVLDVISAFKGIEERLIDSWDIYVESLTRFKERTGNCLVPWRHTEVLEDGTKILLGNWVGNIRAVKKGTPGYLLTSERVTQLEALGFIWDERKYDFEKCINEIDHFKRKNGRYPMRHSNDKHESKLGNFINAERYRKHKAEKYGKIYSEWKVTIINEKGLFDFFEEKENRVDKFCRMALEYKKSNGHLEINSKDIINGYGIGKIYNALINDYKNKKISEVQIKKIAQVGIDITRRKREQQYNRKMDLARQALHYGIVINSMNQNYEGVNLFEWYRTHKDRFSEEELTIMNMLIPNNGNKIIPIKIIDFKTKAVLRLAPSMSQAAKVLHRDFGIGSSEKSCVAIISNRLTGKTKNPVYKDLFIFEYVDKDQLESA